MRLATLNTLRCTRKDLTQDGELQLIATKVEMRESTYDKDFLLHILPSLDWHTLRESANAIGVSSLPESLDDASIYCVNLIRHRHPIACPAPFLAAVNSTRRSRSDDDFLRALHHVIFDVHVVEGRLVCKESGHIFPIEEGIANMMISDDLV